MGSRANLEAASKGGRAKIWTENLAIFDEKTSDMRQGFHTKEWELGTELIWVLTSWIASGKCNTESTLSQHSGP